MRRFGIGIILAMVSCSALATNANFTKVSIDELRKNPKTWNEKRVEVTGYAVLELRGSRLNKDFNGFCNDQPSIGIGLGFSDTALPSPYVRRGTFRGIFRLNTDARTKTPGRLADARLVSWQGQSLSACY